MRKLIFIGLILLTGCTKKKMCDEARIKRTGFVNSIESIKSDYANNNQPLDQSAINDITQFEFNIFQQERIMYQNCKEGFHEYNYEYYQ